MGRQPTNVESMHATDLLAKAQHGDMDAFAELFEPLRPMVHAVAVRLVGTSDADDVVMDTYLKAWQSLPKFAGRSSLKTWLYRLAYNGAVDMVRAQKRRPDRVRPASAGDEADGDVEVPDLRQTTPSEALIRTELAHRISAAMEHMPLEHRAVLWLRFVDGLSYAEIARISGVAIGTVMSRLFYGKRRLRKLLSEEGA
jgi:RNA polymerase sigma-70 factor, ECF subfamily